MDKKIKILYLVSFIAIAISLYSIYYKSNKYTYKNTELTPYLEVIDSLNRKIDKLYNNIEIEQSKIDSLNLKLKSNSRSLDSLKRVNKNYKDSIKSLSIEESINYLNNYLNSRKKQELNKILPHKFGILEKISKFAAVSPL
jgi:peptidoglycan hydrolase CwlO-like protein